MLFRSPPPPPPPHRRSSRSSQPSRSLNAGLHARQDSARPPQAPGQYYRSPFGLARRAQRHMPVPSGVSRLVPHLARRPEPSVFGACGRRNGGVSRRSWSQHEYLQDKRKEWHAMRMVRRGTFTVAPPGGFLRPPHYSSLGPGHRARAVGGGPINAVVGGGPIRCAAACLRWDLYARPVSDALRLELQAARAHLEADRALSAARGTGFLGHRHGSAAWHARTWVVEKGQPCCCRRWGGANAWAVRTPGRRERWGRAPLSWVQAAVLGAHPGCRWPRESE